MKIQVSGVPDEGGTPIYDALIAAIGYEQRSRYIAENLEGRIGRIWAFDYNSVGVHSYDQNLEYFSSGVVVPADVSQHRKLVGALVNDLRADLAADSETGGGITPRLAVDISSMDRDLLGQTVLACTTDQEASIEVDFFYSDGEFSSDLVGSSGAVLVNRPMLGLEGWPTAADAPVVCVIGLGFEDKLATAVVETIEPRQAIALVPVGADERYDAVVRERNAPLLGSGILDAEHPYSVIDVLQTVVDLNASVSAWSRTSRVVIAPLGPKTFALAAVLVSVAHEQDVTVWRMSADNGRYPEERRASGVVASLRVRVGAVEQ